MPQTNHIDLSPLKKNKKFSRNAILNFRKSHAFVIGINEYRGIKDNLRTAVNDAEEIAKLLKEVQGFDHVLVMKNVSKKQITSLLDWLNLEAKDRPKKLEIPTETFPHDSFDFPEEWTYQSEIYWLEKDNRRLPLSAIELDILPTKDVANPSKGDSIVFFYAGHGFPAEDPDGPSGYIGPTDTLDNWHRQESIAEGQANFLINDSLISMDDIYTAFAETKCKHTLLILDCCYAGKFEFANLKRSKKKSLMPLHKERYERLSLIHISEPTRPY